jgi:hypothetical protein
MPRKVTNNVIAGATVTAATSKATIKDERIMPVVDKTLKENVIKYLEAHSTFKKAESDMKIYQQEIRSKAKEYLDDESLKEGKCIGSFFIESEKIKDERIQIVPADKFSVISADPKATDPEGEINAKLDIIEEVFPETEFDTFIEQQTAYSFRPEFINLLESDEDVRKEFNKLLVNPKFKKLLQDKGYNHLDLEGNLSLVAGATLNKVRKGGLDLIYSKGKIALKKLLDAVKLSDFSIKVGAKK